MFHESDPGQEYLFKLILIDAKTKTKKPTKKPIL
jgi:hypothetical protein